MNVEGIGLFFGRMALLLGVTVLLSEAVARIGAGILPLIYRRAARRSKPGDALERFGLGLLLGWPTIGLLYLGLALASLYRPLALAGAALALLFGSRAMWQRKLLLGAALTESRIFGLGGLALLLGLAPAVYYLVLPEGQHDVWVYHLGVPWQYLQAGKAVIAQTQLRFHFPLTFEMAYGLPLILGDDRLAKGMVIMCFVAAGAVFGGACVRNGRPVSGWLGPLLALSSLQVMMLIMMCKSDIPAASLFVAGATLQLAGAWAPAALLMGLCVASKEVYGPIVAVWCLCFIPRRKWLVWWAVLLALPISLWWTKTWLATGNPFYPFATSLISTFDWAEPNREAYRLYWAVNFPNGIPKLTDLPAMWLDYLRQVHLPLLLMLPGLLLVSRRRRTAWVCLGAQAVLMSVVHIDRYLLPSLWLMYFLIAEAVGQLSLRIRHAVVGVLTIYVLISVMLSPETASVRWKDVFAPWTQILKRQFTTFLEVEQLLATPDRPAVSWQPRAPRPARVLSIGEWRTYKFPCRFLFNGMFGETPIVWKMVKTSHDLPELRKKFRQLGAKRLLYNYVTVDWASLRYGSFPWDRRSLRLYVDFCKQHLEILGRTEQCDFFNGGFYVYEIRVRPRKSPPSTVWFAPGTESVYGTGIRLENLQRKEEALQAYLKAFEMLSDVGHAWNLVGHAYALLNDPANAFRYLRKFGEAGMMDSMNLGEFGAYAVRTGQLDLGERVLADALNRYPAHRHQILINQATWNGQKALQAFNSKQVETAAKHVEQGLTIMAEVPETVSVANKPARRTTLAFLLGMRAEVCLVRGQRTQAAKWFTQAVQLAPEVPMAPRWKALAAELGPRLFGGPGLDRG